MEDKAFIERQLTSHTNAFVLFVQEQQGHAFTDTPQGKWSVGQNLEHLIKSLAPVNLALALPRFTLRLLFGKPNRASQTYLEVVDRYRQKLAAGGKASGRFIPSPITLAKKNKKLLAINREKEIMIRRVHAWSEQELDQYLLPHPLMGKLTMREMLYFSVYHIQHHLNGLKARESFSQ